MKQITLGLRASVLTGFTLVGMATVSCGNAHANSPDPVPSGPEARLKSATDDIVSARCSREERCNNVGDGKTYQDHEACTSKLEGSTASDLNLKDCEHGIDHAKLDTCLSKIKGEDCGNPIDTLSRLAACRTGELCIGS